MPLSNTTTRILTAALLIPLVLALVLWAPQPLFVAVLAIVGLLTVHEFLGIARSSGLTPFAPLAYAGVAGAILWWWAGRDWVLLVLLTAMTVAMLPARQLSAALGSAAVTGMAVVYIGFPLSLLANIRRFPRGPEWVIYVLVLTWISDTAAYFAGRAFGRRKLAPRISPGKTVEGAMASLIAAIIFSIIYLRVFVPEFPTAWAVIAGAAVNAAGQVGDLAESALKRGAGVKDSAAILPGHGGLLDRIDALLFSVPALWYIFALYLRLSLYRAGT